MLQTPCYNLSDEHQRDKLELAGNGGSPAKGSSETLPEQVDVAVIGGGFCGLSAARALAKRGVRTIVLEAETLSWGASCRNGGMVLTGMKLPVPTLIGRYGRDAVQRMYAASLESIDLVEQIVREENIECSFSRCGHLEVACKQKHFDDYAAAAAEIKREFNHELRLFPRANCARKSGRTSISGEWLMRAASA